MRFAGLVFAVFSLASVPAMAAGPARAPEHARTPEHHAAEHGGRILEHGGHVPPEHECYSAAQAREKIAARKLREPFRILLNEAARFQAEALGVRLCRRKELYIYEISLLRTNGRVIHVFTSAVTGQVLSVKNAK